MPGYQENEMNNGLYEMKRRRYDLDWLRVLAFGILILYHTGMFYVADWGWHIKSETSSETLQIFMLLVNPWRMPLIFFISGAALWFAGKKIKSTALLNLRLRRLLPPLLLGMLVIVPPQIYYQIIQAEGAGFSYLEFYRIYLDMGTALYPDHQTPLGLMSWTHLWFIPYLLLYTLAFVFLKPLLDRVVTGLSSVNVRLAWLYAIPVTIFIVYGIFLRPYYPATHAVAGDWYNHALYLTVFILGYMLAGSLQITRKLVSARWYCLGISLTTYLLFVLLVNDAIDFRTPPLMTRVLVEIIIYMNGWGWILTVLAFSAAYLNRPGRILDYMNTAILPWYVFHQTLTIILAWHLSSLGLNTGLEATLIVLGTVAGCALGYELVRRFMLTRFLLGLKLESIGNLNTMLPGNPKY
jgi:glucan biosynthesis protein C